MVMKQAALLYAALAAVVVLLAVGSDAISSCDVDLTGQTLAQGAVRTISCPTSVRGEVGYRVTADKTFSVFFTDGSDCTAVNFGSYPTLSRVNQPAGTTVTVLVQSTYSDGAWAYPCVRIQNVGTTGAMTALAFKVEWFPPTFPNQFHLINTGQYFAAATGNDVNVNSVWTSGQTGSGVIVDICDDGLQATHVEIQPRLRQDMSLNYQTMSADPTGGVDDDHGTGCGGVAAADGANTYCGRGAAYGASLAGHRILYSGVTGTAYVDAMWNSSIVVDVSSNSWGPEGCTNAGCEFYPATSAIASAIATGAVSGRQGRGKAYTFAAGNEGHYGGDCNQYPYTKLNEVMTVTGSSYEGTAIWYSSAGACAFVNAPTQGSPVLNNMKPGIITAQGGLLDTACRDDFGGTSSATPLVAGVVALVMAAQPRATARDVQYALALSATKNDPTNAGWLVNGAGVNFNRLYGFGRVNAAGAVSRVTASGWINAGPQYTTASAVQSINSAFSAGATGITRTFTVTNPDVKYIENVIVQITASFSPVQALRITLTSPAGTAIDLAQPTSSKTGQTGLSSYPFGARAFWGESAAGTWSLKISAPNVGSGNGNFGSWQISFYGAATCSPACSGTAQVCASGNTCVCAPGYVASGATCVASTSCSNNPCQNGGTCIAGAGNSYSCRCPGNAAVYNYADCSYASNPCEPNPCLGNSPCNVQGSTYHCTCSNPNDQTQNCQLSGAAATRSSFLIAAASVAAVGAAVALGL